MNLSVINETTTVSRRTEAIPNQRFEVRPMDTFGFIRWMASFVIPTRMPSSGLGNRLTLNTAATPANDAASPTSGFRPTLWKAAAASGISTR